MGAKYQEVDYLFNNSEDLVIQGMGQVVDILKRDLDLTFNQEVQEIDY